MDEKKRILLVDDEEDIASLVKMRLEIEDFDVITAFDGQQALDMARTEKPDLIILDVMLPKMDGYKVCRMLKYDQNYHHIPIILFTAKAQDKDVETGYDTGADAYIIKPFDPDSLLEKVRELLHKKAGPNM